jgi:RNA polymerase sigma-70 factor, ECF subfamily
LCYAHRFKVTGEPTPLEDLLKACASGSESAWDEFVGRFHRVVAATVVKGLRAARIEPFTFADDLIQEVYARLCTNQRRALREFTGTNELAFCGYLRRVAYNVVQDHLRNRRNRPNEPLPDDLQVKPASSQDLDFRLLLGEIVDLLDKIVTRETAERDKTLFLLYFEQGLSARSIACLPAMGLSEKGVESALLRMTRQLRVLMATQIQKGTSTP